MTNNEMPLYLMERYEIIPSEKFISEQFIYDCPNYQISDNLYISRYDVFNKDILTSRGFWCMFYIHINGIIKTTRYILISDVILEDEILFKECVKELIDD